MATHGNIGEFDAQREDWISYSEWLSEYFTAKEVDGAEKKSHSSKRSWSNNVPAH